MGDVELFLWELRQNGLDPIEAKTKAKRLPEYWLSPEGRWFNVFSCYHEAFAQYVAATWYNLDVFCRESRYEKATDFLIEQHWLIGRKIQRNGPPNLCLTNCDGDLDIDMTIEQFIVLYEFYGNKRVYRDWTVPLLWMKNRPKIKQKLHEIWSEWKKQTHPYGNTATPYQTPTFNLIRLPLKKLQEYYKEIGHETLSKYVGTILLKEAEGTNDWRILEDIINTEYNDYGNELFIDNRTQAFKTRKRIIKQWAVHAKP